MKDLVAELLGTFGLVFAITATIMGSLALTQGFTLVNLVAIAFTAGLVLAVLAYTFGPLSGGHFNPVVTLALWIAKRFPANKVVPYLLAQFVGGLLASLVLFAMIGGNSLGATTVGGFGLNAALIFEVIATALFLIVILSVTNEKSPSAHHAALAIGFYLLVAHLSGIAFSGASLNPARSLGPAVVPVLLGKAGGTALEQLWVYFVGPVLGGVLGSLVYTFLLGERKK